MSRQIRNFTPGENKTIAFSASAASANVQFTTAPGDPAKAPSNIEVNNALSVACFVAWGTDNTAAATVAGSYYVGPGVAKVIDIGAANTWVAIIPISSTTGSVYISRGAGS